MIDVNSKWATEIEVQELLKAKTTKLWQLRRDGHIKYSKIGHKVFYSIDSIYNYLNSQLK